MVKKVFRPFWSYDLKKTEKWLCSMALSGYNLKEIRTNTRCFVFEDGCIPKDVHYHIEYNKAPKELANFLKNDGWVRTFKYNRWEVLENEKDSDKIKSFPIRDGIIKRNRFMMYLFTGMLAFITLTTLIFFAMCGLVVFYFDNTLTIGVSPFWILTLLIGLSLWTVAPYSTIKLYKANNKFW